MIILKNKLYADRGRDNKNKSQSSRGTRNTTPPTINNPKPENPNPSNSQNKTNYTLTKEQEKERNRQIKKNGELQRQIDDELLKKDEKRLTEELNKLKNNLGKKKAKSILSKKAKWGFGIGSALAGTYIAKAAYDRRKGYKSIKQD